MRSESSSLSGCPESSSLKFLVDTLDEGSTPSTSTTSSGKSLGSHLKKLIGRLVPSVDWLMGEAFSTPSATAYNGGDRILTVYKERDGELGGQLNDNYSIFGTRQLRAVA